MRFSFKHYFQDFVTLWLKAYVDAQRKTFSTMVIYDAYYNAVVVTS